jgi:glycosyltransferase involved in cell wall biosynthesis
LKEFKPEILQCHLYWSQIWGGILKIAFPKSELVWVEHNMYFNRTHLQWKLYRLLARLTKEIIAVSVEVRDFLHLQNLGGTRFVPNPVSRTFNVNKGGHRENAIAFVGRFNEQKNPILAVKAFEYALKRLMIPEDSKLMMVGDGHLKSELMAYVSSQGLELDVLFTGFLNENELSKLLTRTRVLISTSLHEGCPLVRIEAAASGCTIVTTATGGIKGILSRDVEGVELLDGVFVVETEIFALSGALAEAFSSKLWTSQRVAARSEAMSNFNPESIANAYLVS